MKNVRRTNLFVMAAMALAFAACTDEYESLNVSVPEKQALVFTLDDSGIAAVDDVQTRSFLEGDASNWTFKWENGDVVNYMLRRNGYTVATGQGQILNTSSGALLKIAPTETMQKGDVILTYFNGKAASSTSVTATPMTIPTLQCGEWGKESFTDTKTVTTTTTGTKDYTLTLGSITLGTTSVSNQTSTTPPNCKVTFKVSDYDPSYAYKWSTDNHTWNTLSVASDGKASATLYFSAMNFSSSTATKTAYLYVKCQNGTAARLPITVTGTRSKSASNIWGGWASGWLKPGNAYVYGFKYAAGTPTNGSYTVTTTTTTTTTSETTTTTTTGETRLMPLRNCMPFTGTPVTLTTAMLNGGNAAEIIGLEMRGSVIEFRIYSRDASIGTGETLESVTFTASKPIAGDLTCNVSSGQLADMTAYTVTSSVEGLDYLIPAYESGDYQSVYMVVAPGTYTGTYEIKTDAATYTYAFNSAKTYSAGIRMITSINIANQSFNRVPIEPEVNTYAVTFNAGEGTTITSEAGSGEDAVEEGATYTAAVALEEGYENLSVTVTMGGKTVEGAFANGVVTIPEVTGDIVITATATKAATEAKIFTVTVNRDSSKTRFSGAKEATEGESYSATTRAVGDYALDVVTVTMGGQDISATAYADGKINIAKVTGDIVITVTVKYHPSSYSVEVNTWHVIYEGDYTAESDKPFYATLTPEPGYELSKVVVTMGGYSLNGTYYNDGVIDIPAVNGTIIIEAEAKLKAAAPSKRK